MATEQNNRDVAKKPISKSFRGILRVSPADDGSDTGIGLTPVPVADSMGNNSALSIGTEHIEVQKEIVSQTQLRDKITFGTQTNVPTVAPAKNNILIGDNAGNYEHQDLIEIIKQFVTDNQIMEQTVPVGTIIPVAIAQKDLNLLPQRFRDYYDFADGQNRHSLTGQEYNFDNFPDLYRMVVGTSRLSYKRLRLSLPIIAASLFFNNNITSLSELKINGLDGTGSLNFKQVKNDIQLSNIDFNTTDSFTSPTVEISWQQSARTINFEQSKNQNAHAEYAYLPAGTVVQIQGSRYTFNGTNNIDYAYIYDKEILTLSSFGADGSPLLSTVDNISYSIPKDGIYCLWVPATGTLSGSVTYQQLPKITVTVPAMKCTINATYNAKAKTYIKVTDDYLKYIRYCPTEVVNTAYFISGSYRINFSTLSTSSLDVWKFWNYNDEGVNGYSYLVLEGDNLPYNDIPLELEGNLTNDIAAFNINKTSGTGTYLPHLFLKKGTVITAQGIGIVLNGRREQIPTTIYKFDGTLLSSINAQGTYTIPADGYYYANVPYDWTSFDSNPWRIPIFRVSQGVTSFSFSAIGNFLASVVTVVGGGGQFNLPDLRNKFIRGASSTSSTITSEGTYTIPAHAPLDIEDPQTNPYNSKLIIDGMSGTFFCSIYQANPKATGCFSLVNTSGGTGHRKYNGSSRYATYKLNFSGQVSQNDMTPRETRPYNISLAYLIKVK
jgi:hypothetical protein